MDYFQEFKNLFWSKPKNATNSRAVFNSAYGDYLYRSKNIYLSYCINDSEDCYYSEYLSKCRDCIDCCYLGASELCYECTDSGGLYNCSFMQDCHNCSNCDYCFDCINCKNCFGSFGLRHQQFCVFNKPYPEDIYYKKVSVLKKNPPNKILKILQPEFDKLPRLFCRFLKGEEDCLGDYIYYSKNCYNCFNVRKAENSSHLSEIMDPEMTSSLCVDCDLSSDINMCYSCHNVNGCNNCNFLDNCINCSDSEYLSNCHNCQNCFLCVYLMNKQYCILNRQFPREEYLALVNRIKCDLIGAKLYGRQIAEVVG